MNNAITNTLDLKTRKRYWLADNPGVITRVAEELGVTQSFVSDVFHRRRTSRDGRVEATLQERGAPGFEVL